MSSGRYLYGLTRTATEPSLDMTGINDQSLHFISRDQWGAIVHHSPPRPYDSEDEETIKKWVRRHNEVLMTVKEEMGVVLPFTFNTIVSADSKETGTGAEGRLKAWIKENKSIISNMAQRVEDCDEYGVTIRGETAALKDRLFQSDKQTGDEEEISESSGKAYLKKEQRKQKKDERFNRWQRTQKSRWSERIDSVCEEVVQGDPNSPVPQKSDSQTILFYCSCLVRVDHVEILGEELENIKEEHDLSVQFTGPWPPYSFVSFSGPASGTERSDEKQTHSSYGSRERP